MFRLRDILVRIRIYLRLRILLFPSVTVKMPKTYGFSILFSLLLSVGTFRSIIKNEKWSKRHWQQKSNFFLIIVLVDGRRSVQITDPDPGDPKTYGSGTLGHVTVGSFLVFRYKTMLPPSPWYIIFITYHQRPYSWVKTWSMFLPTILGIDALYCF